MHTMMQSLPSMSHTPATKLVPSHAGWPFSLLSTAEHHNMAIHQNTLCKVCGQASCTLPLAARGSPGHPGCALWVPQLLSWMPGWPTGLVRGRTQSAGARRCLRGCCTPCTGGWQGPRRTEGGRGTCHVCSGDNIHLSAVKSPDPALWARRVFLRLPLPGGSLQKQQGSGKLQDCACAAPIPQNL